MHGHLKIKSCYLSISYYASWILGQVSASSIKRIRIFGQICSHICRSQWPRGLRRRSAAAEIVCSNPTGSIDVYLFVLCCQVEVSATSCSLVKISPTDCGASLCVI